MVITNTILKFFGIMLIRDIKAQSVSDQSSQSKLNSLVCNLWVLLPKELFCNHFVTNARVNIFVLVSKTLWNTIEFNLVV